MRDGSGNQLINTSVYGNPSTALGTALTSDDIWFHGSNAMAANGDQRVKMYAPSTWAVGSSYAHLDYDTFHGTANRLMVYAISAGDSIHDPGPVTKGLLKDLGWPTSDNGDVFDSCSLINNYQPSFEWTANETFSKFTILFSTSSTNFSNPIAKATLQAAKRSWTPPSGTWKNILTSSYNMGTIRDIYWKVVLARPDKSTEETEVRSFRIGISQEVTIQSSANGACLPSGTPPTIVFDTNCNTKFKLEISSLNDFSNPSETKGFSYTVKDPNVQTTLQETLTPGQWTAVKKLVDTGTGYFRIKGSDGLNRETASEVRTFFINCPGIQAPALSSPANGSNVSGTTVSFRWNFSTGATDYYVQVSFNDSFTSLAYDKALGGSYNGLDLSGMPNDGTKFWWRVKAGNGSTWSSWSSVWWFTNGY
jgi:hypothetical protein